MKIILVKTIKFRNLVFNHENIFKLLKLSFFKFINKQHFVQTAYITLTFFHYVTHFFNIIRRKKLETLSQTYSTREKKFRIFYDFFRTFHSEQPIVFLSRVNQTHNSELKLRYGFPDLFLFSFHPPHHHIIQTQTTITTVRTRTLTHINTCPGQNHADHDETQ